MASASKRKTGDADAIKVYVGEMNKISIVLGVMNFHLLAEVWVLLLVKLFLDL